MNKKLSDKPGVRNLIEICASKGLQYVIISPGSRNAPFHISFNEHGFFTCLSIPDERSAAFIALGIAQQTGMPAILSCTSGSASLNYAPAISEAFYQKIPLLILTADRPDEWINQGEGQSIAQRNVYQNYITASYHLHLDSNDPDNLWSNDRMICEAIDIAILERGPVHINIPFREPLYNTKDYSDVPFPKISSILKRESFLPFEFLSSTISSFFSKKKILILCGLMPEKNEDLNTILQQFSDRAVILSETTSNISGENILNHIDPLLTTIDQKESKPELLITIGHSFISKKIKLWLREFNPEEHWHISEDKNANDVFQSLTQHIRVAPLTFFRFLLLKIDEEKIKPSLAQMDYNHLWKKKSDDILIKNISFINNCPWSDFKVFSKVLPALPKECNLHMGNSSPVRYIQLFPMREDILYNGNRGVSGIDGSTSTAIGAAFIHQKPTVILTGDVSFFYDSNAFWNHHLPDHLRVIIINNQGGGIFRLIPGPPSTNQCDDFFETTHSFNAKGICDTFNVNYYSADSENELDEIMNFFWENQENKRPAVLEIFTPRAINDIVFKDYYKKLS